MKWKTHTLDAIDLKRESFPCILINSTSVLGSVSPWFFLTKTKLKNKNKEKKGEDKILT